jgi:hypothetical protein
MNTPKAFFGPVNPLNLKHSEPLFGVRELWAVSPRKKVFQNGCDVLRLLTTSKRKGHAVG